jgi:hypothetical protein
MDVAAMPSPYGVNYWHIDTYRAYEKPYCGNYCLWCGADSIWEGEPLECDTWVNTPGYGNSWNCIAKLALDSSFTVSEGCTLYFDPRYDTECKYDYFYVEFNDGDAWREVAAFNASSNNPGPECGAPTGGNPDYWSNTDTGQPLACDWQERPDPARPAFSLIIQEWGDSTLLDSVTCAPSFRWRFESDGMWSDQDGGLDTDGGAFIDNVWVCGDAGHVYTEDFEHGSWDTLVVRGWSKPDPEGLIDAWHIVHDPDPAYEGGDGAERTSCGLDSSHVWRDRSATGFNAYQQCLAGGWFYRLLSPRVNIENSGCVVQYDQYLRALEYACHYADTKVRFYDTDYGVWCPWTNIDGELDFGGGFFWEFDREEDVSLLYGASADSLQFAWDFGLPGDEPFCCSKSSSKRDYQIDNVSIGFYDGNVTVFRARPQDLLHDSFHDSICAHNSLFEEYDPDTLDIYAGPPYIPALRKENQLYLDIHDKDGIAQVMLHGSIDGGMTWQTVMMQRAEPSDPATPELGGEFYATLCPTGFGLPRWSKGTEAWYYVSCEDNLANMEYFPSKADPSHPGHTGTESDYLEFSILPLYPAGYDDPVILLVDGYGGDSNQWADCIATIDEVKSLDAIYGDILRDAGYCYDEFDINAVGTASNIHPVEYSAYDAVLWFCGPHNDRYLFNKDAQEAIRDYLGAGGKVVVCGDRVAYNMVVMRADSLGGEFIRGILGCSYCDEIESAFETPYVRIDAADTVDVFGSPVSVGMDSLLVYRQCPDMRDMSYIQAEWEAPPGYVWQPLLNVPETRPWCDPAHGAVYIEKEVGGGQCVFVDFDLSGFVTHMRTDCDGSVPEGLPTFQPGPYYGRVDLVRTILEDLFGLPSRGPGQGGTSGIGPLPHHAWDLKQNEPNPFVTKTGIVFGVAHASQVLIRVFDIRGRCVRTLTDRRYQPGKHSVEWDCTNDSGGAVASGLYFYRMEAGSFKATRKLLILR